LSHAELAVGEQALQDVCARWERCGSPVIRGRPLGKAARDRWWQLAALLSKWL